MREFCYEETYVAVTAAAVYNCDIFKLYRKFFLTISMVADNTIIRRPTTSEPANNLCTVQVLYAAYD